MVTTSTATMPPSAEDEAEELLEAAPPCAAGAIVKILGWPATRAAQALPVVPSNSCLQCA